MRPSVCDDRAINPFKTAVPLWGQTIQILSSSSPKPDCIFKRVNRQSTSMDDRNGYRFSWMSTSEKKRFYVKEHSFRIRQRPIWTNFRADFTEQRRSTGTENGGLRKISSRYPYGGIARLMDCSCCGENSLKIVHSRGVPLSHHSCYTRTAYLYYSHGSSWSLNPFRSAVPFWGQTSQILTTLSLQSGLRF